jgi:hypothetical protein
MRTAARSNVRKLFAAIVLALFTASSGRAAERGIERVRIAVSSKSLGFFDTWGAKERDSISGAPGKPGALDRVVDATIVEEVLRERR